MVMLKIPFQTQEQQAHVLPGYAAVIWILDLRVKVLEKKTKGHVIQNIIAEIRTEKTSFQIREIHACKAGHEQGSDLLGAGSENGVFGEGELFDSHRTGIEVYETEGRGERFAGVKIFSL